MNVRCQCGSVSFRTSVPAPIRVYHCHCTECRKQSSTAFGTSAIFPTAGIFPLSPDLEDKLSVYRRPGSRVKSGLDMDCYFCKKCGSRIMHRIIKEDGTGRDTMSVKGGVVEDLDWTLGEHIYADSAVVDILDSKPRHPGTPPS